MINFNKNSSDNLKKVVPKEDLKFSNKRNTGREPKDLIEQLTMQEVKSDPSIGDRTKIKLKDPRWKQEDGWQKWSYQRKNFYNHSNVEIHYNVHVNNNGKLIEIDDFKIKYPE